MKVAVTGASGVVGQFVVTRLLREGCEVAALARPGTEREELEQDVQRVEGDLADSPALDRLAAGADGLVHCAFSHAPGRYRGGEGDDVPGFWRVNLGGTVALLEAAARAGVRRTVLLSSRAVFGLPVDGSIEDVHPTSPTTHYGALKVATEALASVYENVTVLRPTGVYGIVRPIERTKWLELAESLLAGRTAPRPRSGTEVHGKDVADGVWRLLTAPSAAVAGRAFNCSDLEVDTRTLVARMQDAFFQHTGPLPPAAPPAGNVLRCDGLHALGWRPGGAVALRREIEALCAIVRDRGRSGQDADR